MKHIKIKKNEVRIIYLELDDKCAGQTRMSESDITAKINGFPLKEKRLTHISINTKHHHQLSKEYSFLWRYHGHVRFTMPAVVSFDLENQQSFNEGQMYVALSRVTKIDNLFLIGKCSTIVFKVNENAVIEYSRLRENLLDRIYIDLVDCISVTVSLLNMRFFVRHALDISRNKELMENDIMCLTESQIPNGTDEAEMFQQLSTFKVYFNSYGARNQSLAFCLAWSKYYSLKT